MDLSPSWEAITVFTGVPYPEPDESNVSCFSKIHINISPPSASRSSWWYISFWISYQHLLYILSSPMRATCSAHLNLHVKRVAYHQSIARPWIRGGGDVLQI
jgi:hypothetical protein